LINILNTIKRNKQFTMMKLAILATTIAATAAFAPSMSTNSHSALASTPDDLSESTPPVEMQEAPSAPVIAPINGWVPDESAPCYGLPGALAPTGFFDPLGFAQTGITLNDIKRNREAEVMHGRVAMLACLGYFAAEAIPASPLGITGPANDQLQQMPLAAFSLLTLGIAAAEIRRAQIGWVEPDFGSWTKTLFKLRENYYPGDVGFDPLGLKPTNGKDFANMQTKELQNGRLAMIGWSGMCAQELINHRTIVETIVFYQKVFSGADPYGDCAAGIDIC